MKKLIVLFLFIFSTASADQYIIFNMGNVTSWQHRQFHQSGSYYLAELNPIPVLGIVGNRYAIPLRVLGDSNFITVWSELSGFPVLELAWDDFQP